MVLDQRRMSILQLLYQLDGPVDIDFLKNQFGISQRTIYYDMDNINGWLEGERLQPIQKSYGKGFYLTRETMKELPSKLSLQNEWDYRFSPAERLQLTQLFLLTQIQPSPVKELKENVQVSRGTVFRDLKQLSKKLENSGLTLVYQKSIGYEIKGDEKIKRQLLSDTISSILTLTENRQLKNKIHDILYPCATTHDAQLLLFLNEEMAAIETAMDVSFTEEVIQFLTLQILIAVKRKAHEPSLTIDKDEINILENTNAFQALQKLNTHLIQKNYNALPTQEIYLLTMQLLSSRVHHEQLSTSNTKEMEQLQMVIKKIIDDFQLAGCIIFEERKQLEDNLFTHLKPAYYRLKYSLTSTNHYYEEIQQYYPDIYYLTKRALSHLESFMGESIPEEEIAYIAMHFGGWLKRENQTSLKKYKGIVVCENGIAASGMVRAQIETLIPEIMVTRALSIREYNQTTIEADIVFSTSFIKEKQAPIIYVPTILNEKERDNVIYQTQQYLNPESSKNPEIEELMDVIEKHATIHQKPQLQEKLRQFVTNHHSIKKETYKPMLDELITEKTIQFEQSSVDWEEAIRIAATPLLNNESIQSSYIDAMIRNVREHGPYVVIAPNIALPHARPEEGVDRLGLSLLHLQQPVYFSEKEKHKASLVIILAAIDNETHLQALSQLTEMLSKPENTDYLLQAKTTDDILTLVQQYSLH